MDIAELILLHLKPRRLRSSQRVVSVSATPTLVASGTNYRRGCIISNCSSTNSVWLSLAGQNVGQTGLQLSPQTPTLAFHWPTDGDASTREIWAVTAAGAAAPSLGTPASVSAEVTAAGTGIQLSYTVPAGDTAICWGGNRTPVSGTAASYEMIVVNGGNANVLFKTTSTQQLVSGSFPLAAGDSVNWTNTTTGTSSVDWLGLFVTQYGGSSVSTTASVAVWDLEDCECIP